MPSSPRKEAKIKQLRQKVRSTIAEIILSETLCKPLEEHVDQQREIGFLDRDVNRYLLKLYQLHPAFLNMHVVAKILVLAFHNLPEDDFICVNALMINKDQKATEHLSSVYKAYEHLRSCEFEQYWRFTKHESPSTAAYFQTFSGLEQSIRTYAIQVYSWLYQTVELKEIHQALGTNRVEESVKLIKEQGATVVDNIVTFKINNSNSATLKKRTIKFSTDQMAIYYANMRS